METIRNEGGKPLKMADVSSFLIKVEDLPGTQGFYAHHGPAELQKYAIECRLRAVPVATWKIISWSLDLAVYR